MKDWLTERKFYVVAALLIVIGGYYFYIYEQEEPIPGEPAGIAQQLESAEELSNTDGKTEKSTEPEIIMVDVKGQVTMPGVYQANEGERIIDIIGRAGGLTDQADKNRVNLAEHVTDAMVIYIPAMGEAVETTAGSTIEVITGAGQGPGKINVNKADEAELQNLPGIGPAKAAAIIEYRNTSGPFKTAEDLKNISGIGDKTFEKLKDLVVVK